jgi:hypothetical protein
LLPSRTLAHQACIDTLRPLRTAYASLQGVPPAPSGTAPISGRLTATSLGSALPDASLPPGAPRFVVCARVAFKCVSARPASGGSGECEAVRGARVPRSASPFSRLFDTRGHGSRERANAGGALRADHASVVVNPALWAFRPHAVEALPDGRGAVGNDDDGATLFGSDNATRLPAVRPGWMWIQGAPAPPPPPPPPPPP